MHKQNITQKVDVTLRWYFFCSDCRKRPVYIPHIHQPNSKPSPMRKDVPGSIPWHTAVATARAMPPSTKIAWQTQGVVQGVSSLRLSTLRPNKTHGQKSPVQPIEVRYKNQVKRRSNSGTQTTFKNMIRRFFTEMEGSQKPNQSNNNLT